MREPNQHLAQARQRKAALLPRAAALAGEGRSYQEIAAALGVAKSTVCTWLRDRPLGRAAARSYVGIYCGWTTAKLVIPLRSISRRAGWLPEADMARSNAGTLVTG